MQNIKFNYILIFLKMLFKFINNLYFLSSLTLMIRVYVFIIIILFKNIILQNLLENLFLIKKCHS